jgi:hypothetical protein
VNAAIRILERLRNRSFRREAGGPGSTEASSTGEQRLPIAGYDQLDGKQLTVQLSRLSPLELAAVEAHERSHRGRPVVLNRLGWLRGNEPLPGYDALDCDEVVRVLGDADAVTVKAVRSYERHHQNRPEVLAEAARVLPTARASTGLDCAREEGAALVRAGLRSEPPATRAKLDGSRATKTTPHHSTFDRMDAARDQRNELEQLRDEARYRRERLDLYRARLYGGRATNHRKLRELQRALDGAAARLRRAEAAAPPTQPPT